MMYRHNGVVVGVVAREDERQYLSSYLCSVDLMAVAEDEVSNIYIVTLQT